MRYVALLSFILLAGCAGSPRPLGGAPSISVVEGNTLAPPTRADFIQSERSYLIGPFDKLTIDVFGIEELNNREVTADAGGRIAFPLAGTIEAAGMSPRELEQELTGRLRAAHIRDPQVTVNLKEAVSQSVTVDGQVTKPGLYPVTGHMTLMRAVATAQGVSEFAKLDDVVVFRNVDGQTYAALYNLGAIRRGAYADPDIYGNDIVIVGESKARRLFRDILQAAPLLSTPLVVALQSAFNTNGN